jgi:HEAT repeat protein
VAGLRAFQGERSRSALLSVLRSDPSPEVRAAALTAVGGMLDASELHLTASRALTDPHRAVRLSAVALFRKITPEKGLAGLLRLLRSEDDPVVLQAVAEQAEAAFPTFRDLAMAMDHDGEEAILLARVARYMHHPELQRILTVVGRSHVPAVREGVAVLWATRPDLIDTSALEGLTADPSVAVRQAAVAAWAALGNFARLTGMLTDPDPGVRQDIARAYLDAADTQALEPLLLDPDETVRAALFVTRLLRGEWTEPPATFALSRSAAAAAIRQAVSEEKLRDLVRADQDPARRLPAALALAVLGDEAAYAVMRSDPLWTVRDRVGRMLAGWREPPEARQHSA